MFSIFTAIQTVTSYNSPLDLARKLKLSMHACSSDNIMNEVFRI